MKSLILFLLFILGVNANAATLSCDAPAEPGSKVTIDLDERGVNTIDFGTARIYSRWPATRAGLSVSYCLPDDNEYTYYNKIYSIWSVCSSPSLSVGHVHFYADFTLENGGKLKFMTPGGEHTVIFLDCK